MMALEKNVILRSAQRARLEGRTADAAPFLFIIAGEPSGDALGGALIAALRERTGRLRVAGIGGEAMAAQGLASLVRSEEHTSELQSHVNIVWRLLLEKKKISRLLSN